MANKCEGNYLRGISEWKKLKEKKAHVGGKRQIFNLNYSISTV
jgi:hypothetical protein